MRFLFVDRILQLIPGQYIRGIKHITADDACLSRDENGRPIFPASLIGESLGQLAAWNVMHSNQFTFRPVAGVVSAAMMYRPAYLGDSLVLESYIDSLDETAVLYHSVARINNEEVFAVDGALGPLLPMADFIDEACVRQQFAEINRPLNESESDTWKNEGTLLSNPYNIPNFTYSFDQIIQSERGVSMMAQKSISRSSPYFPDHFPRNPVLPMTILLECKLDLAKRFVAEAGFTSAYRVSGMRKIKMNEFVHPGDVLVCHLKVKERDERQLILTFRSEVAGKRVCVMEMLMLAEGA